jgi:hypothetical protein
MGACSQSLTLSVASEKDKFVIAEPDYKGEVTDNEGWCSAMDQKSTKVHLTLF